MQHRKAEDGVSHQQRGRQNAGDDADEAVEKAQRDRRSERRRERFRERHLGERRPRPRQPSGEFHHAGGEPEIEDVGQRGHDRRRRRHRDDQKRHQALGIAEVWAIGWRTQFAAQHARQRTGQAGPEALGIEAEIRNGDDDDQCGQHRGPDDQTAGRIPFKRGQSGGRSAGANVAGARQQREIAQPPGGQAGAGEKSQEEHAAKGNAERGRSGDGSDQRRPMAPAKACDHDRQRGEVEQRDRQPHAGCH